MAPDRNARDGGGGARSDGSSPDVAGAEQGFSAHDPMGCPVHALRAKLRAVDLRPTAQRVALAWLLFGEGNRHVSAESLHEAAIGAGVSVSLATVYNTLHQFAECGLLWEISIDGARTLFDTNTKPHYHFLVEETGTLIDIPEELVSIQGLPAPPTNTLVARVDLVVRLRSAPPDSAESVQARQAERPVRGDSR